MNDFEKLVDILKRSFWNCDLEDELTELLHETWESCDNDIIVLISQVVTRIWPEDLYNYAESVIHGHAINQYYFKESHLNDINVLEDEKKENARRYISNPNDKYYGLDNDEHSIITREEIIDLLWNTFNLEEHFERIYKHRCWVRQSYEQLKEYLKPDRPDQEGEFYNEMDRLIDKHDLSKYTFSQAIGYCLKWVHNKDTTWDVARCIHLYNEPHHVECWRGGKFSRGQYGGDMQLTYLYESFIDIVAQEWEKRNDEDLTIPIEELMNIEDEALNQYNAKERQIIDSLINRVINKLE